MGAAGRIRMAVTGSISLAPVGAPGPTSATSPLSAQWVNVGFISDGGVVESVKGDPSEIVPWRSARVARVSLGLTGIEYKFTMLEANQAAIASFYGVGGARGREWHHVDPREAIHAAVVFTMIDGDYVTRRWVPKGVLAADGDMSFLSTAASAYPVRLTALSVLDPMGDGLVSRAVAFYSEPIPA